MSCAQKGIFGPKILQVTLCIFGPPSQLLFVFIQIATMDSKRIGGIGPLETERQFHGSSGLGSPPPLNKRGFGTKAKGSRLWGSSRAARSL
mmetsp:Transcript_60356/g.124880  ORF Transcript_60356/g.124880 Transcript_60356/m.124880 type:complete len:91 (-) Transcript_60356:74-346(-)